MPRSDRLLTSVSPDKSARFGALAQRNGVSKSKLLSLLVDAALAKSGVPEGEGSPATKAPRSESRYVPPAKYTVRVQGLDAAALEQRAEALGMPASSYAAQVLRAHLRANPPVPYEAFQELKRVVNELGGIRAHLIQLVASDNPGRFINPELGEAVRKLLPALKTIREDVQNVLIANSKAWTSGDA